MVLFAAGLFLSACTNGVLHYGLYTHTVQPLTFNRDPTNVKESDHEGVGRITEVTVPYVDIRVGNNGFGNIAKEHGITKIYYADIERWTAAFGIWRMDVVHIYGR